MCQISSLYLSNCLKNNLWKSVLAGSDRVGTALDELGRLNTDIDSKYTFFAPQAKSKK